MATGGMASAEVRNFSTEPRRLPEARTLEEVEGRLRLASLDEVDGRQLSTSASPPRDSSDTMRKISPSDLLILSSGELKMPDELSDDDDRRTIVCSVNAAAMASGESPGGGGNIMNSISSVEDLVASDLLFGSEAFRVLLASVTLPGTAFASCTGVTGNAGNSRACSKSIASENSCGVG